MRYIRTLHTPDKQTTTVKYCWNNGDSKSIMIEMSFKTSANNLN